MNRMKKISTLLGMPWGSAQRKLYRLILIELLKRLNENICFRCSKPIKIVNGTEGISVDHIENWESEGSARKFWDINNVRYSHLKCNLRAATDSRRKIGPEGTAWCYLWNKVGQQGLGLQMTRALGDSRLSFVSREPEIIVRSLKKPSWILVASDGLIDPTHQESSFNAIVNLIDAGAEAKELVTRAIKLQTNDNATAVVWRNK